jgi:hypothetical protein
MLVLAPALRLVFSAAGCHIRSMPLPDLTKDENAALVELLSSRIARDRSLMSPRLLCLKGILAKLDPASVEPAVTAHSAEESERVIVAAIEKHARGDVEALARGIIEELRDAGLEIRRSDAIPRRNPRDRLNR